MGRKDKNKETVPETEELLEAKAGESREADQEMVAAAEAEDTLTVEQQQSLIETLQQEKQKNYDLYLRALAEIDNMKKRSQREREEYVRYGTESLLKRLLNVMDDLERALAECERSRDLAALTKGVELTAKNLEEILKSEGIEPVKTEGQPFDPQVHQALMVEPREDMEENMIIEEMQKGYKIWDRLLRPALVRVSG
ncbi:MAG: nucleotide exchange factor GrpE [Syntrophomonadaceae bacterium]|nr:nucleotide exchange factor GrpE [Syntrophomonadaceae bacterium]